jgi:hypothetical protein
MKRIITAVVLALATTAAHATADGCAVVRKTPDGFLNVRQLPIAGSPVVGRVVPGDLLYIAADATCQTKDKLSVCNESGEWTKVDAKWTKPSQHITWTGPRGWVATRYLDFVGDCHGAEVDREKHKSAARLPAELLGKWCLYAEPGPNATRVSYESSTVVDCKVDGFLIIKPDGWQAHESGCKFTSVRTRWDRTILSATKTYGVTVATITSACSGEACTWRSSFDLFVSKGTLWMDKIRNTNEVCQ